MDVPRSACVLRCAARQPFLRRLQNASMSFLALRLRLPSPHSFVRTSSLTGPISNLAKLRHPMSLRSAQYATKIPSLHPGYDARPQTTSMKFLSSNPMLPSRRKKPFRRFLALSKRLTEMLKRSSSPMSNVQQDWHCPTRKCSNRCLAQTGLVGPRHSMWHPLF